MKALAAVDRYVVLGNPVAHSQSPFIHAQFARQTGQAMVYERLLCELDGFDLALAQFAAAGGRGCNVTVPFKFDACRIASRRSARAALAQAANVLRRDDQTWSAENTDGVGLVRDIEVGAGVPLAGRRMLLVGAGGAAAGVLGPLLASRPALVVLANRSPDKAAALAARHQGWAHEQGVRLEVMPIDAPGRAYDVVINATSSSLQAAASPVDAQVLAPGSLAVDLMYGSAAEPFLAWAAAHGAQPRDGLGMLVEQAASAFEFWRGVMPETAPVLRALRARLAQGA